MRKAKGSADKRARDDKAELVRLIQNNRYDIRAVRSELSDGDKELRQNLVRIEKKLEETMRFLQVPPPPPKPLPKKLKP